jgi:signal peptidase II
VRPPGPGFGRAAAVAVLAIAADQISKAVVRGQVVPGRPVNLVGGIDIVRVENHGIAFGLLEGAGGWVLVVAAVAFASLLAYFLSSAERPGLWLPIGLLAGGAIGNLIDRAREGFVTDFIDPPGWPAFNIADVQITVGVVMLVSIYAFGIGPADPSRPSKTEDAGDPQRATSP